MMQSLAFLRNQPSFGPPTPGKEWGAFSLRRRPPEGETRKSWLLLNIKLTSLYAKRRNGARKARPPQAINPWRTHNKAHETQKISRNTYGRWWQGVVTFLAPLISHITAAGGGEPQRASSSRCKRFFTPDGDSGEPLRVTVPAAARASLIFRKL
jgi:hypothetical protein